MAAPVLESSNTGAYVNASSVTITKPTGLAVGDIMVAVIHGAHSGAFTLTTPSGWTSQKAHTAQSTRKASLYTKTAESADVAASNFTFAASTTVSLIGGYLGRVSGAIADSYVSEVDFNGAASSTAFSFTAASTPLNATSLVLMAVIGQDGSGLRTVSGYGSTPSLTWTEDADINGDLGAADVNLAIAHADTTATTQITNYNATFSISVDAHIGFLILLEPTIDATGTNALLSVSPTHFDQAGIGGTTGTNTLLEVSPTQFNQSGYGQDMPVYTNDDKSVTTWTNDNK